MSAGGQADAGGRMAGHARSLGRAAATLLLAAALLVLLALGFSAARAAAGYFPGWSLRWHSPISGQAAAGARAFAAEKPQNPHGLWPTFWAEEPGQTLESELRRAEARCIRYSGSGAALWPARFAAGTWPGAADEQGCAISSGLAQALWGSADVVGKTLQWNGQSWPVRGVFEEEEPLAMFSVGDEGSPGGWQNVELAYTSAGESSGLGENALTGAPRPEAEAAPPEAKAAPPTRQDIETFAAASGLGAPSSVLDGAGIGAMAGGVALLPACAALAVGLLVLLWRLARPLKPMLRWGLWFLLALAFALALPSLLDLLPAFLIPTKWSDFAFWGSLISQLGDELKAFLFLHPTLRDVQGKLALYRLAALAAAQAAALLALARMNTRA